MENATGPTHPVSMKSKRDEQAERKFDEQLQEFGFLMDAELSDEEFVEFSRHARHVLHERELLERD